MLGAAGIRMIIEHRGAVFIDQCKHWSILLFLFPSPAREKKCKRIPRWRALLPFAQIEREGITNPLRR